MIVAGIGFRKGASANELVAAVDAASSAHAVEQRDIAMLAVLDNKCDEAGVHVAAGLIGCPVIVIGKEQAMRLSTRTPTVSAHSLAATGTSSACETAALAAAGPGARLLGPRIVVGNATCALAVGDASA